MSIFDPAAAARRLRLQYWLSRQAREGTAAAEPAPTTMAEAAEGSSAVTPQSGAVAGRRFRPLAESLADRSTPMTWVFTGQSLPGPIGAPADIPLSGLVGVFVRTVLERTADPIIDTTGPDLRVRDLLKQFGPRVARFRPHVVVVGASLSEADRGIDGLPRFEHHLVRFIHECRRLGSDVVLQTPRYVPGGASGEDIDGLVYVEAIRSIAAEQSAGLVDAWEADATAPQGESADRTRTSELDAERLLARFVADLELLPVNADVE